MAVNISLLNSSNTNNINTNFERVEAALQEVLGRDGSTPNQMNSDFDMNGNDILNVRLIQADDISINDGDITGILTRAEEAVVEAELAADEALAAQVAAEAAAAAAEAAIGGFIYSTADDLLAATVPALVNTVFVAGDASAGDDFGGEPIMLVRNPAATVGFLLDASGAKWYNPSRKVILSKAFHGADNDGTGDNKPALVLALTEVLTKGGGELHVPAGDYQMTSGSGLITMTCDLTFTMAPDAKFIATAGVTTPMINIRGSTLPTSPGPYTWLFPNGLNVDMSACAFTGNQPSGLQVANVRTCHGVGGYFNGGGAIGGSVGGDSGIEPLSITDFKWTGGIFIGWIDAGIYLGGSNDLGVLDDGGSYQVTNAYFERCGQGITFKRAGNYLLADGNTIVGCSVGITSADVGAGQEVKAGQRMIISNNFIKKTIGRAIGIRSNSRAEIIGNLIEDWGYTDDGVTLGAAAPNLGRQAILFQGGQKSTISNNTFRMLDWAESSHVGILVSDYDDADATNWDAGFNYGEGNFFDNVTIPLYEMADSDVQSSTYVDNRVNTVITFASIRTNTVFRYTATGNLNELVIVGVANVGVRYIENQEKFSFFGSSTYLSAIGSLASATTSATINIPVPGALNGDSVVLTPLSSGAMNARLNYAVRAVTDQVDVQVRNDHTAAVDFTALSFNISVVRR